MMRVTRKLRKLTSQNFTASVSLGAMDSIEINVACRFVEIISQKNNDYEDLL